MTRPPDLPPYPQYKPSGIPWLDDIPAHWEMRRLKYVATTIMGQSPHLPIAAISQSACLSCRVVQSSERTIQLQFNTAANRPKPVHQDQFSCQSALQLDDSIWQTKNMALDAVFAPSSLTMKS